MTESDRPSGAALKTYNWRRPPTWVSLLLFPIAVLLAFAITEKRGIVLGVLAGVVYGSLAVAGLALDRVSAWSKAHPVLDSIIMPPLLFFALAYLTPLSLIICLAITAAAAVPWFVLSTLVRRRRSEPVS
ncbi:hypothetical protein GCM10022226_07990 [Sphaerisporangium flaviroseum]|uniref:Uncharacterized protein n=1 Tax=Sphaerisporangium flaviroseum TaxID=509199 RepID=A0ABP7HG11_9ACTN